MQAVQCMANELRADGRAFDIRFSRGYSRDLTNPKLGYAYRDLAGGRHYIWIEISPNGDGSYGYFAVPPTLLMTNDPAREVWWAWTTNCRVEVVLVT